MSELTDVLAAHLWRNPAEWGYGPSECAGCDWSGDWLDQGDEHAAHLADVALAWLAGVTREWAVGRFDEHGPMDARGAALWDVAAWASEQQSETARESHRIAPRSDSDAGTDQSRTTDSGEAARGTE